MTTSSPLSPSYFADRSRAAAVAAENARAAGMLRLAHDYEQIARAHARAADSLPRQDADSYVRP